MDQSSPVPPAAPESFNIGFDRADSTRHNPMFQGKGRLTVDRVAQTFTFTGEPRSQFAREEATQVFSASQMRHVVRNGTQLAFLLDLGAVSSGTPPFVFFCEDEEQALRVRGLFPASEDPSLEDQRKFAKDLAALPAGSHWWTTVTGIVVLLNVVSFVVMAAVYDAGWVGAGNSDIYVRFAGNNGAATTSGEWWRLLTSMFAHYGIIHLLMNMWALINLGQLMERLAGRTLFALIYFTSGICGGLASIWWNGDKVWSAGASGAVFGILAATLGYILRQRNALPGSVYQPMLKSSLLFIGYNLLYGFAKTGIDNADHLGGFGAGLTLGWLTALPLEWEKRKPLLRSRFVVGAIASVALIAMGVAASPRFNYSVSDEVVLQTTIDAMSPREVELQRQSEVAFQNYRKNADTAETLIHLLERDVVPFYTDLERKFASLSLRPGMQTDQRRQVLVRFAQAQAAAGRQLLSDVKARSEDLSQYISLQEKSAAILRELKPEEH